MEHTEKIEWTANISDVHRDMVRKLKKPGEEILAQCTPEKLDLMHMATGVAGEGGELLDAVKRWVMYNKPLDYENVKEELGDLEFFIEGVRQITGITREQTLEHNFAKLGQRYKNHEYTDQQAHERADKLSQHNSPTTEGAVRPAYDPHI
jgi:NTP pyrophosphatase (non-canonical NTP hydrolase)